MELNEDIIYIMLEGLSNERRLQVLEMVIEECEYEIDKLKGCK